MLRFFSGSVVVQMRRPLVLVSLALLSAPGVASAGPYRYVAASEPVAENSQNGVSVSCPGDEPVVAGGALATGFLGARTEINTTQPFDDDGDGRTDDGWEAYADNLNSGDISGEMLGVLAVCDKRAAEADYRYRVSQPSPLPDGQQGFVSLTCRRNEPVTGGGVRSSGFLNDAMHVNTTRPFDNSDAGSKADDGWIAWVDNEPSGQPGQEITGFAICDRRRTSDAYRYPSAEAASPDNSQRSVTQPCPTGTSLVGGGLRSSGSYADGMYATESTGLIPGGSSTPSIWSAEVNNVLGGAASNTLTVYAVCR